jgi:hypothetical protein
MPAKTTLIDYLVTKIVDVRVKQCCLGQYSTKTAYITYFFYNVPLFEIILISVCKTWDPTVIRKHLALNI